MLTPKQHHRRFDALGRSVLRSLFLSAILVVSIPFGSASAIENPKWFLLRNHQTGTCWPTLLLSINGQYQHAFAQKAGGPYKNEAQAIERQQELKKNGTCA